MLLLWQKKCKIILKISKIMNALSFYRAARWCYLHKIPFFPRFLSFLNTWFYSCKIPYTMPVGKGTRFAAGGMCLNLNAESIGDGCVVGTMCVMMRSFPYKEKPRIGNHVYISHGVKFVGPVIVGDNSMIAANCVVTKSVPANAIVAGVPGKIIGWTTNLEYNPFENPQYKEGYHPFLKEKSREA